MSRRIKPLQYLSDNLLRELGPINESTFPATAVTAGTCTGRIFDDTKDSRATAAVVGLAISVEDTGPFVVGDTIYIRTPSGGWFDAGPLIGIDAALGVLSVTNSIAAANKGARVAVKLGPDIAMSAFGAAITVGQFDWGYQGTIADDHAGLAVGMRLRIETEIDSAPGVKLTQSYETYVEGGT